MLKTSQLVALLLLGGACATPRESIDAGTPDAGAPPRRYTVHVFDVAYSSIELSWFDGTTWATSATALSKKGTWWLGEFTGTPSAQFSLKANGDWYPGGTTTYRPGAEPNVWLKDGLLFSYEPNGGAPTDELTVLTVNLHTYQEPDPIAQVRRVAEVIAKANVDLVAFQECAQRKDAPVEESHLSVNVRTGNMAKLIVAELAATWHTDFTYYWDWSHYGFTLYEEGSAVLGRSTSSLLEQETRVISLGTDRNNINTRTAIYGAFELPNLGRVHLFSTHVSWGAPQAGQLDALTSFASEKTGAVLTLLAGDYNMAFGSDGYVQMLADGGWSDSYLEAAPGGGADLTLDNDRIDYQFKNTSSRLVPVLAQRVFLQLASPEAANQRASDHLGVLVHYRLPR